MQTEEIKAEIAVLGVKLDSIQVLLETKLTHLDDKIDHNRANADMSFDKVRRDHAEIVQRVHKIETALATTSGSNRVVGFVINTLIAVIIAIAAAWAGAHWGSH